MAPGAGYAAEMQRLDDDLATLSGARDPEGVTRRIYRLYQKASISGDLAALTAVDRVIDDTVALSPNPGDLYLLKAHAAFKLHKLNDVDAALRAVPAVYDSDEGRLIRADLDFQHGHYQSAVSGYADVLQRERSWGALARLAHLRGKMGDAVGADQLYEEAQDQLTAKEMRAYAWLEVQRGFLDFVHGRHGEARQHYRRADTAYPGYWLVAEHIAEVLGAERRYAEAGEILERIVSTVDRPDLAQAIAELYQLAGQREPALYWKERALNGYLQSAQRGEVHYYHHLADYYSDVAEDGAAALKWARKDLRLRENFATQAALAWALYRDGQFSDAVRWIDCALASGIVDARLFLWAGDIYSAAGNGAEGHELRQRATEINPAVAVFHIHH
jgi:tetratricopeptide (TPR) repeat protein